MIILKSPREIDLMRTAGKVTAQLLEDLKDFIRPGITTLDIDRYAEEFIRSAGMTPTFKNYEGFPGSVCASINDMVVHGIPDDETVLKEGDIISIDTGATYKGYVSDAARTYPVGKISYAAQNIIAAAEAGFFAGLPFCKVGYRLSDISHAIQEEVEGYGFGVVRDLVGHGVGKGLHEDPQIPNYGKPGRGPRLAPGMVFAIEPMITEGSYEIETLADNWGVVTVDGGLAAHYENTVVITDGEPELLTLAER